MVGRVKLSRLAGCLYAVPAEWSIPPLFTQGHRHSAGFPSWCKRKMRKGAWPPDRAPFSCAAPPTGLKFLLRGATDRAMVQFNTATRHLPEQGRSRTRLGVLAHFDRHVLVIVSPCSCPLLRCMSRPPIRSDPSCGGEAQRGNGRGRFCQSVSWAGRRRSGQSRPV
jgi:hypothetical protein